MSAPKEYEGKVDWSVFPFKEAENVVRVFEYGKRKYGRAFSYREGLEEYLLISATIRHLVEIMDEKEIDNESNESHWAHIAANALMALSKRSKR